MNNTRHGQTRRRIFLRRVAVAAAAAIAGSRLVAAQAGARVTGRGGQGAGQGAASSAGTPRAIHVVAQRFLFRPAEIQLEAGESVVLEIESLDFVHGFHVPALDLRTDLMPGRVTRVALRFPTAGQYDFQCDNFCGDGHENMHGRFIVSAPAGA